MAQTSELADGIVMDECMCTGLRRAVPMGQTEPSMNEQRFLYESLGHRARILIVDDEMVNVMLAKAYLEEAGYDRCLTAMGGREALAMLGSVQPDIIILDVMMPDVSGLYVLRSIRHDDADLCLPVLIVTASNDPQIKLQALELGATDFLSKPVDSHELAVRVRNVLMVKAYQDQLATKNCLLEVETQLRAAELIASQRDLDAQQQTRLNESAAEMLQGTENAASRAAVAVEALQSTLERFSLAPLADLSDSLTAHADDLPQFLFHDERAKRLPSQLNDMVRTLAEQQQEALHHLAKIRKRIDEVNGLVPTNDAATDTTVQSRF